MKPELVNKRLKRQEREKMLEIKNIAKIQQTTGDGGESSQSSHNREKAHQVIQFCTYNTLLYTFYTTRSLSQNQEKTNSKIKPFAQITINLRLRIHLAFLYSVQILLLQSI